MAKRLPLRTEEEKAFAKTFEKLTGRHNAWTVWSDFVTLYAISISCSVDRDPERFEARKAEAVQIWERYTDEEREVLDQLGDQLVRTLEKNPDQDFLGEVYMALDFGSDWHGQFFTPWHIAHAMASMTLEPKETDREYISVSDPTCGAGVMLLAAATVYHERGINFQEKLLLVGQDIDRICALMAYIQLSLRGAAGYIAVGNTLTKPLAGTALNPTIGEGGELWFTPRFCVTSPWVVRRELELLMEIRKLLDQEKLDPAKEDAVS